MKRLLLFAGLFILLAILAVVLLTRGTQKSVSAQHLAVSANLASAVSYGTNSLVYSNGQNLVSFNYITGSSTPLSSNSEGLGTIDTVSVSANNDYVLFHDQAVTAGGNLYNQLSAQGLDPTQSYWWLYSSIEQSYTVLPTDVVFAKLSNNSLYTLTPGTGNEILSTYNPANLSQIGKISVPGSVNFFPTQSGFILVSPQSQVLFTKDGIVNQVLFDNAEIVGVAGNTSVAVEKIGGSRDLVKINLTNFKTTVAARNVEGSPAWLNGGEALYLGAKVATDKPSLYEYSLSTNSTTLWNLSPSLSSFSSALPVINSFVGPGAAIIGVSATSYVIVGTQQISPVISSL